MKCTKGSLGIFGFVVIFFFATQLSAQVFELHPYAGGVLSPSRLDLGNNSFEFKSQGIYGVRADFFLARHFEVGGNFAYLNHFELKGSDPNARGYLWEANGNYRFDRFEKFKPFVGASIGGITVNRDPVTTQTPLPDPTPIFDDNASFLTISYGGGIKSPQLWGPVGLRADVRGRTLPDVLGEASTWLEVTGGLTFTF